MRNENNQRVNRSFFCTHKILLWYVIHKQTFLLMSSDPIVNPPPPPFVPFLPDVIFLRWWFPLLPKELNWLFPNSCCNFAWSWLGKVVWKLSCVNNTLWNFKNLIGYIFSGFDSELRLDILNHYYVIRNYLQQSRTSWSILWLHV